MDLPAKRASPVRRQYTQVIVRCSPAVEEPLAALFSRWGAAGTASSGRGGWLELCSYLPRLLSRSETPHLRREIADIVKYVAPRSHPRIFVGRFTPSIRSQAWKREFAPVRAGRRFLIVPPWHLAAAPGRVRIVIPPAMAFGTGHHPTTRACLALLERIPVSGARVLDIGTGTGILAIAAARLGAAEVLATDSDPLAVEQAEANVRRNRVTRQVQVKECDLAGAGAGRFDLVVANIDPATIIRLSQRVPRLLRRGGVFLASGFTANSLPQVGAALRKAGLTIVDKLQLHGWLALTCRLT